MRTLPMERMNLEKVVELRMKSQAGAKRLECGDGVRGVAALAFEIEARRSWTGRSVTTRRIHKLPEAERSVHSSSLCTSPRRLFSPNRAATQSLGLVRLRTYPGVRQSDLVQPQRGCGQNDFTRVRYADAW